MFLNLEQLEVLFAVLVKKDYLPYTRSVEEIAIMRGIKQVFDPKGLMNPGKIFDI